MSQKIKIDVWGGAGEHGRSCYRLQAGQLSVLLDCGGKKENGGLYPRLDPERVQELGTVFLSHAHEDHMAALPLLLQHGYAGEVWLTRETYRQLPAYARSWRNYVLAQGGQLPYDSGDWERLQYRFMDVETPEGKWLTIGSGLRFCWGPSGHLPGAVWLLLDLEGELVFFSGDYSLESTLLQASMPDPALLEDRVIELAIIDAAYGDAPHTQEQLLGELIGNLEQVRRRGGHALLPVPVSGRGLDLVVELSEKLPAFPLAAEASLVNEWKRWVRLDAGASLAERKGEWQPAAEASVINERKREVQPADDRLWLREDAVVRLAAALDNIRVVGTPEERRVVAEGPAHILLSPDGMMLAEPARTYGAMLRDDPRHGVLFTGHLSKDAAAAKSDAAYEVFYCRYKVHQGLPDVIAMLRELKPARVLLVHAGAEATKRLELRLEQLGLLGATVCEPFDTADSGREGARVG